MTKKINNRPRADKGDGHIRQTKSGTYEGLCTITRKDGTTIRKSITRKNKYQVKDIMARLRALGSIDSNIEKVEINKQTDEIILIKKEDILFKKSEDLDQEMLVDQYADFWLWNHRRRGQKGKRIKDTTFEDYYYKTQIIKNKIGQIKQKNGQIRKVKVNELTLDFIENQLLELFEENSLTTATQVRNHIFNMMKWAKKDGIIKENPLADETINFPTTGEKFHREIIEEDDIESVIKCCLKYWYIDVLTQVIIGARASEIRGLIWEDINEEKCEIHIANNYVTAQQYNIDKQGVIHKIGTKSEYTTLKSDSSDRIIKVDKSYMKILMIHKELQKQLAKKNGIIFKETDPVFTGRTYKPLGKNTTNERIQRVVKELGIENWDKITSHCLRKGFCCASILNDVPIEYVSQLMGHNDVKVTLRILCRI